MTNFIEKIENLDLPVIRLRGIVVFPGTAISLETTEKSALDALDAAVASGGMAFFVPQLKQGKDTTPCDFGTVGRIKQNLKATDGSRRVIIEGMTRANVTGMKVIGKAEMAQLIVRWCRLSENGGLRGEALVREAREAAKNLARRMPKLPVEPSAALDAITSPDQMADFVAAHLFIRYEDKLKILSIADPMARIEEVIRLLYEEEQLLVMEQEVHKKVQERMNHRQREAVLHEQLRVIQDELGMGDDSEVGEYRKKILMAELPDEVEEKLLKELERLSKSQFGSAEGSVIRTYLDTCLGLPWKKTSKDRTDLARARKILNEDHDGIEQVKERIIEYLAVKRLTENAGGQILCLVGAPGVGKTSVASSIARALGRKYVRVSLGGVRDEAEIRGHRKTYVGAMPGRITAALMQAKTKNPVILLDEIDKMTHNNINGDPASAMLEVLDPEQNKNFRDNYVELPFDLSQCMFIATANTLDTVPRPLLDRMEVIEMKTYTRTEKLAIAKNHMIKKQTARCGINRRILKLSDDAILAIIDRYTKEAGVRNLERKIGEICRKCAMKIVDDPEIKTIRVTADNLSDFLGSPKLTPDRIAEADEIGAVNGLAYTELGGDMLRMEALVFDGTGKLELTGKLGDVMKESAKIAVSFVRSRAKELGIDPDFYKNKDIHIHVPEGAVPKDGPSAGVTLVTVIASALSGIPVRRDLAMTGEVTLRGNVLAIGGLREKTLAAYAAGVKTVLIPEENAANLDEVADVVKENIEFIRVKHADEVLKTALVR
ncbi:MAG: endopeptidase La [Ruminococcaceae bacterium]|nr:endopeptidase La [Oscillospiraceae bacterium]